MDAPQFRKLLSLGDYGKFWLAMLSISEQSQKKGGDFATAPLESLPPGIVFPEPSDLSKASRKLSDFAAEEDPDSDTESGTGSGSTTWTMPRAVHYDPHLQAIVCWGGWNCPTQSSICPRERTAHTSPRCITCTAARAVSTMFIGGGGFVFPRWIETLFPHEPVIDVAEIDPAVKLAVQREMGLPADDQTQVRTHIGNARHFVDECLRRNAALESRQETPRRYDFVYGDAFNDFSVPWHLTTLEFTQKIEKLLTPGEGVYLVNIIDIYPRAEYPAETQKAEYAEAVYKGSLPDALRSSRSGAEWEPCRAGFGLWKFVKMNRIGSTGSGIGGSCPKR